MAGDDDSAAPPQNLHRLYTVTNIQHKVRVLDGQKVTYPTWMSLFQLHAKAYGVLHHINGTPKPTSPNELALWDEIDAHVLLWIYGTLTDDLLARVHEDDSTAYEAFNRVKNMFDNDNRLISGCLPHEIMMEIFSWLPVKTVVRLKCVSKALLNMVLSPAFFQLHLGRGSRIQNSNLTLISSGDTSLHSFNFNQPQRRAVQLRMHPEVVDLLHFDEQFRYDDGYTFNTVHPPKIIGLVNGVICYRKAAEEFVLYNPVTRAYKQVPRRPGMCQGKDPDKFAYDCVSDDFKIFSFSGMNLNDPTAYGFHLYSLKQNSWSKIGKPFPGTGLNYRGSCHDISSHCMYWITGLDQGEAAGTPSVIITRFDVSSYEYKDIGFPSQVQSNACVRLEVWNKQLHVLAHDENKCKICILKMEDGCWTQLFYSSHPGYYRRYYHPNMPAYQPKMPAYQPTTPTYQSNTPAYQPNIPTYQPTTATYDLPLHAFFGSSRSYSKDGGKIFVMPCQNLRKFICCDIESQTSRVVQVDGLREDLATFTAPMPWTPSLVPLA